MKKNLLFKGFVVVYVTFMVVSIICGIKREVEAKENKRIDDIYVDNGIQDVIDKRSTEFDVFIYYDGMFVDDNGDYYVNTGIGGTLSKDKGTYSKSYFSKEYVEYQKENGIEGEVVTVNKSLYDINK